MPQKEAFRPGRQLLKGVKRSQAFFWAICIYANLITGTRILRTLRRLTDSWRLPLLLQLMRTNWAKALPLIWPWSPGVCHVVSNLCSANDFQVSNYL